MCAGTPRIGIGTYCCFGNCDDGVNAVVLPTRTWISNLRADDASVLLKYLVDGETHARHFGRVDEDLAVAIYEIIELEGSESAPTAGALAPVPQQVAKSPSAVDPCLDETANDEPYTPSLLVSDREGPESITEYVARGGYEALQQVVNACDPYRVVTALRDSGLRGKGGARFPTGDKWQLVLSAPGSRRFVVANGGEHEPDSRKDRTLLERYPHAVLEGVLIAAHTLRAPSAYIYVTADQSAAIASVGQAINEAAENGYCNSQELTAFQCRIACVVGPATYIAGEETAVMNAIEGTDPRPRAKPPYPTTSGLYGEPTLVNNVETFATVPLILRNGSKWYRGIGTLHNPGFTLVTLGAGVNRPGVYEVPYGTTLRKLIDQKGLGTVGGKRIKAILPGGPSFPFLSGENIDVPLEYDSLKALGSGLGCGAIRVWLQDDCMVETTLEIAAFFAREQCGLCPMCGMQANAFVTALNHLKNGTRGKSAIEQIERTAALAYGKGRCSLVAMAAAPVASAIRLFREDFQYHIDNGRCPKHG